MPMSEYMANLRRKVGHDLLEVPSVSIIVRDGEGRVLLVRHENDDLWTTPGGAIEPEEAPADAAAREMWEETGLHVRLDGILGVYGGPEFVVQYKNGDRTSYAMIVFAATRVAGDPRPDGVETLELRYFSQRDLESAPTPKWLPEILSDVFAARPSTAFRPARWAPGL